MKKLTILFIDDEARRMRPILEEFQSEDYSVEFKGDVDGALKLVRNSSQLFDVIVMDISMSSGEEFKKDDTDGGTRTGLLLYEAIRAVHRDQKIVIYTNVATESVRRYFDNQNECLFIHKPDVLPYQFVEIVRKFAESRHID